MFQTIYSIRNKSRSKTTSEPIEQTIGARNEATLNRCRKGFNGIRIISSNRRFSPILALLTWWVSAESWRYKAILVSRSMCAVRCGGQDAASN